jgi:hypothetical protein
MGRRGSGDKIHQRRKQELEKEAFARQKENKNKIADVIIACEDETSAPTYFRLFVAELIRDKIITQDSFVIADHGHTNPSGVLKDKCTSGKTYKDFEHKWIAIDSDIERVNGGGHTAQDFNDAMQKAKKLKVEVAHSNDSFELWYLLHFCYRDTPILRDEILDEVIAKLKAKNKHKFSKLNKDNIKETNYTKLIFEELVELQDDAVRNATKLLDSYGATHNPEEDNPSTTVHKLVEVLLSLTNNDTLDEMVADKRIDALKSCKSEVVSLEEVFKKAGINV